MILWKGRMRYLQGTRFFPTGGCRTCPSCSGRGSCCFLFTICRCLLAGASTGRSSCRCSRGYRNLIIFIYGVIIAHCRHGILLLYGALHSTQSIAYRIHTFGSSLSSRSCRLVYCQWFVIVMVSCLGHWCVHGIDTKHRFWGTGHVFFYTVARQVPLCQEYGRDGKGADCSRHNVCFVVFKYVYKQ